jgi:hypothetical protein
MTIQNMQPVKFYSLTIGGVNLRKEIFLIEFHPSYFIFKNAKVSIVDGHFFYV